MRKSRRVARNSNATQDVREGKKNKIQCADKQEQIDELFWAIDREREADHEDQEELLVRAPNCQRRRLWVRRRAQVLHTMSTAVNIQPRVPL